MSGGKVDLLKASAIIRRPETEDPLNSRHRAALVALAEVVIAGHFDDVGDIDQATYNGERKPARDGEGDPMG